MTQVKAKAIATANGSESQDKCEKLNLIRWGRWMNGIPRSPVDNKRGNVEDVWKVTTSRTLTYWTES